MVVGDESALKAHVHTDDPGAALTLGAARGVLEGIEIANMHRQTEQRETRLLELVPDPRATEVVAVVAGEGNARLFRSLGATSVVEGGQSMNPSTADILAAVDATSAPEVVLLPNNPNVILSSSRLPPTPPSRCWSCALARSRRGSRRWSPTTAPVRRRTTRPKWRTRSPPSPPAP